MNAVERLEFLEAMRETAWLIKLTQAALRRARTQCHGEVYEQVNSLTKHVYDLRAKSEWLRYAVLGGSAVRRAAPEDRKGPQAGLDGESVLAGA